MAETSGRWWLVALYAVLTLAALGLVWLSSRLDAPPSREMIDLLLFGLPVLIAGGIGFVWQRRNPPATWRMRRRYSDPMGWALFFGTTILQPLMLFWMFAPEGSSMAFVRELARTRPDLVVITLVSLAISLLICLIQTGIGFTLGAWLGARGRRV